MTRSWWMSASVVADSTSRRSAFTAASAGAGAGAGAFTNTCQLRLLIQHSYNPQRQHSSHRRIRQPMQWSIRLQQRHRRHRRQAAATLWFWIIFWLFLLCITIMGTQSVCKFADATHPFTAESVATNLRVSFSPQNGRGTLSSMTRSSLYMHSPTAIPFHYRQQRRRIAKTSTKLLQRPPGLVGRTDWSVDCLKTAIAGGVAGAVGTMVLYPLDAAKTIRQASPSVYTSIWSALHYKWTTGTVYRGLGTAVIGAIPSSALYFGAYETMRRVIGHCIIQPRLYQLQQQRAYRQLQRRRQWRMADKRRNDGHVSATNDGIGLTTRCLWHAAAAASGNLLSSAVFVPKELIKQKLQFTGTGNLLRVISDILLNEGLRGFYRGYRATVLRNIPSAALRFALYEEFKRHVVNTERQAGKKSSSSSSSNRPQYFNWRLFVAGAAAGALASGIMTPIDVVKTKIATGTCPVDMPSCVQTVVSQYGVAALWTGAGSRMLSSAAFSAIGFGTYEAVQRWLGVTTLQVAKRANENDKAVLQALSPFQPNFGANSNNLASRIRKKT